MEEALDNLPSLAILVSSCCQY